MHIYHCTSMQAYFEIFQSAAFVDRYALEWHMAWLHRNVESFRIVGFCQACSSGTEFSVGRQWSSATQHGVRVPNWREQQVCSRCGLNSRQRLAIAFSKHYSAVHGLASGPPKLYMMEQVTPLFRRIRELLPQIDLTGSEYLGYGIDGGSIRGDVRHEDAMALSFDDAYFDLVVSNDVLEHVPFPAQAMSELARVLKPGGNLFLTIPFFSNAERNVTRATVVDGGVRYLLPAEYHGNPLSDKGSLVFTDFGWEALLQLREAGFARVSITIVWSHTYGHLGIPTEFIHAVR
jgi:hypothetical protein